MHVNKLSRHLPNKFILTVLFLFFAILAYSVVVSGLYYQYDIDELSHVQYAYLRLHSRPHLDFQVTFTPFFHWLLIPIFSITGFNFDTIFNMRILMVFLFVIRLLFLFFLVRKLFTKLVAYLFLPLILLDPFTVFSAMQIRPDNLMLTIYSIGLFVLFVGLSYSNHFILFLSGIIISLSLLTLLKILPAVLILFIFFFAYVILKRNLRLLATFGAGFLLMIVLYFTYYLAIGTVKEMMQQVFLDRVVYDRLIMNPSFVGFYYKPNNIYLFGLPGKPLTWVYIFILPILSISGVIFTIRKLQKSLTVDVFFKTFFIFSLFIQWMWIFTIQGMFAQYFLLIGWLWALFAAVTLDKFLTLASSYGFKNVFLIGLAILFAIFSYASIKANISRSKIGNKGLIESYTSAWKKIGKNELTFPNLLFRPIAYPLAYGNSIPDLYRKMVKRFGPAYFYLEKYKIKYILLDSYTMMFMDPDTKEYIKKHYSISKSDGFYRRIE